MAKRSDRWKRRQDAQLRAQESDKSKGPKEAGDTIEVEGIVVEQLRNAQFRVELGNGKIVLAHTAGKMRKFLIRIMPGDRVVLALSPYDLTRGRIVYRHR